MTPHPVFEKDLGTDILDAVVRPSSGPTAIVATRTRGVKAVKEDYLEGLPWSNAWQPKIPLQSGNFTLSDTALTLVFADAQSVLHWETFLRESDPCRRPGSFIIRRRGFYANARQPRRVGG